MHAYRPHTRDTLQSTPGSVLRSGYLIKRGGIIKSWKKRHFSLNSNGIVSYYDEPQSLHPLGQARAPMSYTAQSYVRTDQPGHHGRRVLAEGRAQDPLARLLGGSTAGC